MSRRVMYFSAFVAVLMVSAMAYGQQRGQGQGQGRGRGGFGMMGRGGAAMLLRVEAVQKELGLSEEQTTKLSEMATAARENRPNLGEMSQEERDKYMADQEKKYTAILNDKQAKRLEEIRVQTLGSMAAADAKVAKALGLSEEQKEKIQQANDAMREKMRAAMSGDQRPDREAMTKMREETVAAVAKVLTEEQTAKLEKLKGKAFEMPQGRQGGNRGGGGRRGN